MQDFRKLKVWERSHELSLAVYRATRSFPREEIYGITSQMRRAAISIPSNIAEGCGRSGISDFARFLDVAMGSAKELEYQLLVSHDLGFLNRADHESLSSSLGDVQRMLSSLISRVRATE